jgi:hypothetical protein
MLQFIFLKRLLDPDFAVDSYRAVLRQRLQFVTRKLADASVKFGRKILVSNKFYFTSIRGLHQMYFIRQNISICYKCIFTLKCLPDC